jgi:hypothetical protein
MPTESPFREEDQQARIAALLVERAELAARLKVARRTLVLRSLRRVGGFVAGLVVLPGAVAVVIAAMVLSR